MKVSVIVPTYNMERYIGECLDSILSQTLKDIEIICIDDGSTDGTMAILQSYSDSNENILVIKQERQGAGIARNKGICAATGEFIAFMDSDDFYPSNDVLECLYSNAVINSVSIAGGSVFRYFEGRVENATEREQIFQNDNAIISSEAYQYCWGYWRFIYQRDLIEKNGLTFPDLKRNQDPPFMLEAFVAAGSFWVTSKFVYANRVFDKKIDYSSARVVSDIIEGNLKLMAKANEVGYEELQKRIIARTINQLPWCIPHIINGHTDIYTLLGEIGDEIISNQLQTQYSQAISRENIEKEYSAAIEYENSIISEIKKFSKIIIYGAGGIGKTVYDFISQCNLNKFLGFAITNDNSGNTARGNIVKKIDHYSDYTYSDDVLVIIAGSEKVNDEMKKKANDMGYANTFSITQKLFGYTFFTESQGKFAF